MSASEYKPEIIQIFLEPWCPNNGFHCRYQQHSDGYRITMPSQKRDAEVPGHPMHCSTSNVDQGTYQAAHVETSLGGNPY